MRWRYDQRLIEAVIFQEVQREGAEASGGLAGRYHRLTGPLYDLAESDGREQAFFDAHWRLFVEQGFDRLFSDALSRFPRVAEQVPDGLIARALSAREEGGELFVRDSAPTTVVVGLRPTRFLDRPGLAGFCRHELSHIDDMLDPAFGYQKERLDGSAASLESQLTRERYRALWASSIDGRTVRRGLAPVMSRAQRAAEFDRIFPFLEGPAAAAWFERIWSGPRPTHPELLEMAQRPRTAMASGSSRVGLPCPLCRFPSHTWVDADALPDGVEAQIQAEFPSWVPAEGLCERCAEVYTVQQRAAVAHGADR